MLARDGVEQKKKKKKTESELGVELKKYLRVRVGVRVLSILLRLANPGYSITSLQYLKN